MIIFLTVALVLFSSSCQEVYSWIIQLLCPLVQHFWNHLVTRSSSYSWMIQSALNDRRLNASDWSWIDWKRGFALDCIQQHMNVWIKRTSIVKIWRWIVFRDEEGWLPHTSIQPPIGGVFRSIYIWFGGGLGGIHRQHTMHNGEARRHARGNSSLRLGSWQLHKYNINTVSSAHVLKTYLLKIRCCSYSQTSLKYFQTSVLDNNE
jgi:hypothetical protein